MSAGNGEAIRSYHGQPVLKEPVWTWEIPAYFFTGGVAGASAGFAYLNELRGNDVLARRSWAAAFAAVTASPGFLVSDLGRPERFLNMLRMFKVTSPMSVGSWILAGAGATISLAALNAWTGRLPRSARLAKPAAAALGLPLSTYTAALVANTAVPVWHEARRELPFMFGAGAALGAGAVGVMTTPVRHAAPARRLALAGAGLELGAKQLMEKRLGELGEPYRQGSAGSLSRLAQATILAGAALLARRGDSRRAALLAGSLMSIGGLAARWSVYKAGFQSAADPKYVVGPQRQRIRSGRRPGAARRKASVAPGDPASGSPATAARS